MKREKYIDIAKGIATILVIIGHCEYTNKTLLVWLYSFHMPLFFMINGFFIKNSINRLSLKEFTKRNAKTILIPYLIFSIPLYIAYIAKTLIKYKTISRIEAIQKFLGIFLGCRDSNFDIGLWFLVSLFVSDILVYIILKNIFNNKKLKEKNKNILITFITIILYTIGIIITTYIKKRIFIWNLDIAPLCTSFVLMGYLLNVINEKKDIISNKFLCIIMFFINAIFAYLNYKVCGKSDIYGSNLGNGFYYILAAISGSIFIIQVSKFIGKSKILETIGKHSLIYYALQGSLVLPISKLIVTKFFEIANINNNFFIWLSIIVLAIIILEILSKLMEKIMPKIFCKR